VSRRVRNTRNAVKLRMKSYTVGNRRPKVEVLDYVGKIRQVEHSQHATEHPADAR
jgi:hypothetical protein